MAESRTLHPLPAWWPLVGLESTASLLYPGVGWGCQGSPRVSWPAHITLNGATRVEWGWGPQLLSSGTHDLGYLLLMSGEEPAFCMWTDLGSVLEEFTRSPSLFLHL